MSYAVVRWRAGDVINTLYPLLSVLRQSSSFINPKTTLVTDVLRGRPSLTYASHHLQIVSVVSQHVTITSHFLTFIPKKTKVY